MYNFTLNNNFSLVLAYHTQGKELYWQFQNYTPSTSFQIANRFSVLSGYEVADTPYNSSFAGFKDWFIQDFRRPGFTIEAGIGINPLPISQFNDIYNDNVGIYLKLLYSKRSTKCSFYEYILSLNSFLYHLFNCFLFLKIKTFSLSILFMFSTIKSLLSFLQFQTHFKNSNDIFSLHPGISGFSFPLPFIYLFNTPFICAIEE